MRTILITLLISVFIVNCEEGGEVGSSTLATTCKTCGDFITNDRSELNQKALDYLDADSSLEDYYSAKKADGTQYYPDVQLFNALRGYVHAMTVTASMTALCTEMSDVYTGFGLDNDIVTVAGVHHSFPNSNSYCMLDVHLPNGTVAIDIVLNRLFIIEGVYHLQWAAINPELSSSNRYLSTADLVDGLNSGLSKGFLLTPDGFSNAGSGWSVPASGTFYQTFENEGFGNHSAGRDLLNDFYADVFQAIVP